MLGTEACPEIAALLLTACARSIVSRKERVPSMICFVSFSEASRFYDDLSIVLLEQVDSDEEE